MYVIVSIRQENRQIEEELATYKDEVSKYKVWQPACAILIYKALMWIFIWVRPVSSVGRASDF